MGCLLHTLLVGRPVIWKGSPSATCAFIREEGRRGSSLWAAIEGCPAEIQKLLDYMTATDPRRRYCDAVEAVDAIAACLQYSAISPELPPQRTFQPSLLAVAAGGGVEAKASGRRKAGKPNQVFRMLAVPSIIAGVLLAVVTTFSMWRTSHV